VMRDITDQKEIATMKSEFVDTVSHDLRAPLTVIKGYATLAETTGPVNDKQRVALQKIRLSVGQMTELIDNLLDLGRIEAGIDVTMSQCQLGSLIRDVALRFRAQAEAKGLTLTVKLPLDLPPVAGDPLLLGQAIANLVDNAIKYTPAGFVHVDAGLAPNEVVIGVRDSGIGIPPADQSRLFEKFYRVRNRDTIKIHGTGLGLSIVKSIAEQHGGRIWVESVPNEGSSFHLSLPSTSATSDEGDQ
jgi:two-component system phosphate regulon sensor histidine kinase PhoR